MYGMVEYPIVEKIIETLLNQGKLLSFINVYINAYINAHLASEYVGILNFIELKSEDLKKIYPSIDGLLDKLVGLSAGERSRAAEFARQFEVVQDPNAGRGFGGDCDERVRNNNLFLYML